MRTFLVLICSLALACGAAGAQKEDKSKKQAPKKTQAQETQHAAAAGGGAHYNDVKLRHGKAPPSSGNAKRSQQISARHEHTTNHERVLRDNYGMSHDLEKTKSSQQAVSGGAQKTKGPHRIDGQVYQLGPKMQKTKGSKHLTASAEVQKAKQKTKGSHQIVRQSGQAARGHPLGLDHALVNKTNYAAKYDVKHFNLQTKTRPATITGVTFQQNRRIVGSQNWQGQNYWAFRNYTPVWHDRIWWNNHYNRVVFVYGGWYYWNAGWWYPAWGYAPNAYYAYDGPIYAYNGLPPDQVIANVQAALQEQGYYQGDVDGLLGPLTRDALADYQGDHGLYETAAIDQPTLESLGMS